MPHLQDPAMLRGQVLLDRDGDKIGRVEDVYVDTGSGAPEWALVHTGLFGRKATFVPIGDVSGSGDEFRVPYEKAQVKDAPRIDPGAELSGEEERTLYLHYGLAWEHARGEQGRFESGERGATGPDVSGRSTDDAMTRSEEELKVGKASREAGRARLRKYIVTEHVQTTVPVQREEVRVEREPITEGNVGQATRGPEISEAEHEVVLHEEEPVVEKRTVPKERVRMEKETFTDERQVGDEVRKERIEVEGEGEGGRAP